MNGPAPEGAREGTVLVVGVGGLGTPCAWGLAELGVARLVLVDPDRIEPSNLPRQLLFRPVDVGRPKAVVAAERLARAGLVVQARVERFDRTTAPALLSSASVVVDATDGAATKDLVHALALRAGLPVVHAAALGHEGRVLDVPAGGRPCVACLFGIGGGEAGDTCARFGVLGSITAAIGFLAAQVAWDRLARPRAPSRGLRVLDGAAGRAITFQAVADPRCPVCAGPPDGPLPALAEPAACGDATPDPAPGAPPLLAPVPDLPTGVLDLRDEACPMNLLRARRALDRAAPGEVVELWLGEEGIATVPGGLAHLGHAEVSRAPLGTALALRVRRGAGVREPVGSDAWLRRFARQIVLPEVGEEGQRRLSEATVEVGGAGDAFVAAAWVLGCAGVGELRLRGTGLRLDAARAASFPFEATDGGRTEAEALADALLRHGIAGTVRGEGAGAGADGGLLRIDVGDGAPVAAPCRARGALALAEGALAADRALRHGLGLVPAATFVVRDDATISGGGEASQA